MPCFSTVIYLYRDNEEDENTVRFVQCIMCTLEISYVCYQNLILKGQCASIVDASEAI